MPGKGGLATGGAGNVPSLPVEESAPKLEPDAKHAAFAHCDSWYGGSSGADGEATAAAGARRPVAKKKTLLAKVPGYSKGRQAAFRKRKAADSRAGAGAAASCFRPIAACFRKAPHPAAAAGPPASTAPTARLWARTPRPTLP